MAATKLSHEERIRLELKAWRTRRAQLVAAHETATNLRDGIEQMMPKAKEQGTSSYFANVLREARNSVKWLDDVLLMSFGPVDELKAAGYTGEQKTAFHKPGGIVGYPIQGCGCLQCAEARRR